MFLMDRDGQDIGALNEDFFGAVAVVNVPIDDCDFKVRMLGLGSLYGNSDVGEQAEALWFIPRAMVARRAGERIGVFMGADKGIEEGGFDESCRKGRDLVGAVSEGGATAIGEFATMLVGERFEGVEVGGWVDAQEVFSGGMSGCLGEEVVDQAGHIQKVLQTALGFGIFRETSGGERLHETPSKGCKRIAVAGMPEAFFIPIECSFAHIFVPCRL